MLVVISKPAREKQPVRAALHLISRQHEKAFKEPRVSLTVISMGTCNSFSKLHEIVAAAPIYKLHELGAAGLGATAPSSWSSELRCSEL